MARAPKRPTDVTGNAVRIMQILTGEAEDEAAADDGKDPAAKALGANSQAQFLAPGCQFLEDEERKRI